MSGCKEPSSPISIQLKSVSPDGTPTLRTLSPAEAKQFVESQYANLEVEWTISLLRQIFGVPVAKESERSKAARLLLAIKSNAKRLQKLKRDEMRRLDLVTKRPRTMEMQVPSATKPEDRLDGLLYYRDVCQKNGTPFPFEDLMDWEEEKLKREKQGWVGWVQPEGVE